MIEAAKLETSKTEVSKLEGIKIETITKGEPTKPEIVKSEEMKSEKSIKTDEIIDTEIKLESSDEPEETKVETADKINDTTSDQLSNKTSESTSTEETVGTSKIQDEINVAENIRETSSNEKSELLEVDNGEDKKAEITDNKSDDKHEELSNKQTEEPNDKSESIDQRKDADKPEKVSSENVGSDTQEKDKDESQIHEADKTINNDGIKSKIEPSIIKESNENINNVLPSATSNKPETKSIEQIVKSKECSTSVESVDRLKAMFPELEVVHKDMATVATGTSTIDKLPMHKPLQQIDQTIAHLLATSYQNPIKWPKVIIYIIFYYHLVLLHNNFTIYFL